MSRQIVFHIGYHKTATSWMQRLLFTPEHGYRQLADHTEVFRHIVQPHGLHFDPAGMSELIAARMLDLSGNYVPVVSSEILSGHPFQGGHESDVYAARIKQVAPDAKILISIRNQMSILPSVYMQYLLRGGTMPYDIFFEGTNEPGYFGFTTRHFEYDLLVSEYQRLFGENNVIVLTQESLQRDMATATKDLAGLLGNDTFTELMPKARKVNAASYPEYAVGVLRRINHVQRSTLNPRPIISFGSTPNGLYRGLGYILKRPPVSTWAKGRKPVSDYVRRKFDGIYKDSNARLAALIPHPIDLNKYEGAV